MLVNGNAGSGNFSMRTSGNFGLSKGVKNSATIYVSLMGSTSPVIGKKKETSGDASMSESRDELRGSLGMHFPASGKYGSTGKRKKLFGSGFKTYDLKQLQQQPFSATTNDFGVAHSFGLNDFVLEAKKKPQCTLHTEQDKTSSGTNVN